MHFPNKDDWNENFWANKYLIVVTAQGIQFKVNAQSAQEAIDYVIDYCEIHLPGLLWDVDDKIGKDNEYICGGNHGRYLSTHNITIERITA